MTWNVLCILPEQPTRESLAQNGLPQAVGAGEVGLDGCFEFVDDGQAALDFGHDLLVARREAEEETAPS